MSQELTITKVPRVGGEYPWNDDPDWFSRVISVRNGVVFHRHCKKNYQSNNINETKVEDFWGNYLPEDQSLIPSLVEALREVERLLTQRPPTGCDAQGALKVIGKALKAAAEGE